jgi:uncharacterized protein (TIGR00255 family)
MMKSMTAFGRAERTWEEWAFAVEIRCLNRRYCEVSVRMPQKLFPLEDRVKKSVLKIVSRGRVDVTIKIQNGSEPEPEIELNVPLARAHFKALGELAQVLAIDAQVGLETLLGVDGIISAKEREVDLEKTWEGLSGCLEEALKGVEAMRIAEGNAIYEDFQGRLKKVEESLGAMKALAPAVLADYQDRLMERIAVLTEGKVEIDPNRLAQEAAFLADKSDVTEEIVRAESHLKQFRAMMESQEPSGRALDFLLQELNREVNTIGSKAGDAELSHMVVALKSELEKIREQVQNVE